MFHFRFPADYWSTINGADHACPEEGIGAWRGATDRRNAAERQLLNRKSKRDSVLLSYTYEQVEALKTRDPGVRGGVRTPFTS